jgi:hypothetical protein
MAVHHARVCTIPSLSISPCRHGIRRHAWKGRYNRAVFPDLLATTSALDAEIVLIAHKNRGLGEQVFLRQLGRRYALEYVPTAELHDEFRSHGIDIIVGRRCVSMHPSGNSAVSPQ